MSQNAAVRYLESKGWEVVEEEWFRLQGHYEEPVCVDTAYELQKMMDDCRKAA
jgi:hypothetical protein